MTASLADLRARIRERFSSGVPNGWALDWDRHRLESVVAIAAEPFECSNATSFDYARCNTYEVRVPVDEDSWLTLTANISFVDDYYSMHWTRYEQGGRSGAVTEPMDESLVDLSARVGNSLVAQGFAELPAEWEAAPLPGVELELSEDDDVTVGKCLFHDFDG